MAVRKRLKKKPKTTNSGSPIVIRQETALDLLKDLQEHRVDPHDLTAKQRRSLLLLIYTPKKRVREYAAQFQVSVKTIRKDLCLMRRKIGREITEFGIEEVVGQLAMAAEQFTSEALKQEDIGLAWSIQRDFARTLKDFGVIGQTREQQGFKVTVEAIGDGFERAAQQLANALDPALTGEVIDIHASKVTDSLPLSTTLPGTRTDPNVEIVAVPQTPEED